MNNDGMNFFNFAIAVAVACNADTRPKGETKPEAAAQYIQNVLDMAFVNTGLQVQSQTIGLSPMWQDSHCDPGPR